MLPPDLAARLLVRVDLPGRDGKTTRAYRLPRMALALLFMGGARRVAVTWAAHWLVDGPLDSVDTPQENGYL